MNAVLLAYVLGMVLILGGGLLLKVKEQYEKKCYGFLRNNFYAYLLFGLACCWFLIKIAHLGEADFGQYKNWLLGLFLFSFIGCGIYWRDFLVVRGIAMLILMGIDALLDCNYMSDVAVSPVISLFFYGIIILTLFFGTYPYRVRDVLPVLFGKKCRLVKYIGLFCIIYGVGLIGLAQL